MKRIYLILICTGMTLVIVAAIAYAGWNNANPEYTCAQCHEVAPSHEKWLSSAHAKVQCTECHGTAMSDGLHSLKEKTGMVFTHLFDDKRNEDIHLTEEQVLAISDRCATCHQSEHAGWLASGHAVNYREIFMDSIHNAAEKPYWDCLRCHGMFFDGNIHDLMTFDGEPHEWKIKDGKQETLAAVPCLACHSMHTENTTSERYVSLADSSRKQTARNPKTSLYVRTDKVHLRSDKLTKVSMISTDGKAIDNASDPNTLLCQQCHAPDYLHRAGSEDDRTPTGIHEGISCIACHKPHSGNTQESCAQCHPSLTEEQIKQIYNNPHGY